MISDHEGGTIIWENIKDKEKNGKVLLFLVDLKELVKFSVVPHTHTHMSICTRVLHNQTTQWFPLKLEVRSIANLQCKHMESESLMDSIISNHLLLWITD